MSDLECPYCGADNDVCHDDGFGYAEGVYHEITCRSCDKNFVFQTSITFHYESSKADCLNGSEHNLKFRRSFPEQFSSMICKDCDYERRATADEIAQGIK